MIHVIKHGMDPNSNINYRRKIGPKWLTEEQRAEIQPAGNEQNAELRN